MDTRTAIPISFEEIRSALDPSCCYMIFETDERPGNSVEFLKIKTVFQQYEKNFCEQILYREKATGSLFLVVKLNPDIAAVLKQEILNINLPKNISIYFYSRNRKGLKHTKERL